MKQKNMKNKIALLFTILVLLLTPGCSAGTAEVISGLTDIALELLLSEQEIAADLAEIPEYEGDAYVVLNNNEPNFTEEELVTESFEYYSELDELGRCGVVIANVGKEIMPTEERGSIGSVKPTGWHTVKYDIVQQKYLYNRCHLIGFQLTGENANERNLITGTRYLNMEGMLPFENDIAKYVKETGNHVLYRATPVFEGDDLLAKGVVLEALSVEDRGEGIMFHVYCYNVQPGIEINYTDGSSRLEQDDTESDYIVKRYVCNISTKKFHEADCSSAYELKDANKKVFRASRATLIEEGYTPCGICNP